MMPSTLAAIPAALPSDAARALLDLPVADFISSRMLPHKEKIAAKTISLILRMERVGELCGEEAESLLTNRFPREIATALCLHLWHWLRRFEDDAGADGDDLDDESAELADRLASTIKIVDRPYDQSLASPPRDGLPAIPAPPASSEALDARADIAIARCHFDAALRLLHFTLEIG
jgi:hypothetical protein